MTSERVLRAFRRLADGLVERDVLDETAVTLVARLVRRYEVEDPEALVWMARAELAPRRGHMFVTTPPRPPSSSAKRGVVELAAEGGTNFGSPFALEGGQGVVAQAKIARGQHVTAEKKALARELRNNMTPAESLAWSLLRRRGVLGLRFRRQQVIHGFIVDFYCARLGIVLEIDGAVHEDQVEADHARDAHIRSLGKHVVRVKNEAVSQAELERVLYPYTTPPQPPSSSAKRGVTALAAGGGPNSGSPFALEGGQGVVSRGTTPPQPSSSSAKRGVTALAAGGGTNSVSPFALEGGQGVVSRTGGMVALASDHASTSPFVLDGDRLYTRRYFTYERRIAQALRQPRAEGDVVTADERAALRGWLDDDGRVDERKVAAVEAALTGSRLTLAGGPGTGKTYTVRVILALLWVRARRRGHGAPLVALAAPTGKAAARMTEAIQAHLDQFLARATWLDAVERAELRGFLDGLGSSTIHRLLGYQVFDPTRFKHDAAQPLYHDVVIVDEASMIDVALMSKLVDAVRPETKLILIGDPMQLQSVAAGTVFGDLCAVAGGESVLAGVTLTESRRFGPQSGIGRFARATQVEVAADDPHPGLTIAAEADDIALVDPEGGRLPAPVLAQVVDRWARVITPLYGRGETTTDNHARLLTGIGELGVVCAHRSGPLGLKRVNRSVAEALTAQGLMVGRQHRRVDTSEAHWLGRPIIIRKNDRNLGLYNGDIGVIVERDGARVAAFLTPEGVRYVGVFQLPVHDTAFAITIHQSQGSEFDHTVVVLPPEVTPLLSRELVYTAVTRAKTRLTVVAHAEVLDAALRTQVQRATGLRELMAPLRHRSS